MKVQDGPSKLITGETAVIVPGGLEIRNLSTAAFGPYEGSQ